MRERERESGLPTRCPLALIDLLRRCRFAVATLPKFASFGRASKCVASHGDCIAQNATGSKKKTRWPCTVLADTVLIDFAAKSQAREKEI